MSFVWMAIKWRIIQPSSYLYAYTISINHAFVSRYKRCSHCNIKRFDVFKLERKGKCPMCSRMYLITEGTQPRSGEMSVAFLPPGQLPLASYEGEGTICIEYSFPQGIQGPEHPNPGQRKRLVAYEENKVPCRRSVPRDLPRCVSPRHSGRKGGVGAAPKVL